MTRLALTLKMIFRKLNPERFPCRHGYRGKTQMVAIIFLILCLRSVLIWYGFDRMPLLNNNDEAIHNDPALAIIEGKGFIAPSYPQMGLDRYYGHNPPVYPLIQAAVFKVFGITPISLRGVSIACFILCGFLFLILVKKLKHCNALDKYGAFWAILVFLTEPAFFAFSRMGRSETLALCFLLVAFTLIIEKGVGFTKRKIPWGISAVLIGLALSCHFENVTSYVIFCFCAILAYWKKPVFFLWTASLPGLIALIIWITFHQQNSWAVIQQLLSMYHCYQDEGGFRWGETLQLIFQFDIRTLSRIGGFEKFILVFSLTCLLFRNLFLKCQLSLQKPQLWEHTLIIVTAMTTVTYLLLEFKMNTYTQRMVTVFPLACIGFGIAISQIKLKQIKFILTLISTLIVSLELMGCGFYLLKVSEEWNERDPERLVKIVETFPKQARIAAVPVFWYPLKKAGRQFQVIHGAIQCVDNDVKYLDLNKTDIIITDSNDFDLLIGREDWERSTIKDKTQNFGIYNRKGFN